MKKILVGERHTYNEKDRARAAVYAIQEALMGRTLVMAKVHEFITIQDIEKLCKGEPTDLLERYKAHLEVEAEAIEAQIKAERFKQNIPYKLIDFKQNVDQLKSVFSLPEFMPNSVFSFVQADGQISAVVDEKAIKEAIEKYCTVYAETDKEIKLYELAKEIKAKINDFNDVLGLEGLTVDAIVVDTPQGAEINVLGLSNMFNALRK